MNTHPKCETDLVAPRDACPRCGQRDIDLLIWIDDDRVECKTCGTIYNPLTRRVHSVGPYRRNAHASKA